jgi:hypothetical protein
VIKLFYFILFIFIVTAATAAEPALQTTASKYRATFDTVSLPSGENMGLYGHSLLYDWINFLSVGPSSHGAMTGQRGGLDVAGGFVGQVNVGLGYQLSNSHSLIAYYGYIGVPQGNFR